MAKLKIGDKSPAFSAIDQNGESHSLKDQKGKWVVLYFYPRDMTPGCTAEACSFRDANKEMKNLNAVVFGVSTDSGESHGKMAAKHDLNFPLLVDEDKKIVKAYGVWGGKKFMGREFMGTKRWTFLIDPSGKIAKIYEKVKPRVHVEEVLNELKFLQG